LPQIEVTFDIDANGILNVSARDKATGKTQAITITASSGLAKDEVERMVREAQSHADEDKRYRELVDLRNQADSAAYNLEKLVKENREKLGEADAKSIEEGVAEARKALEGEDAGAIRSALERLTALSHKVAEQLYKGAPQAEGGAAPGGSDKPDDVVDAEYTVKN
jgi:molecular chaperone DnaK